MKTITLPNQLNLKETQHIQVFNYHTTQSIAKQQIVLNKNTFSFLTEGTKEVFFDNSTLSIENSEFLIMKSGHCLMTEKLSEKQQYSSVLFFFSDDSLLNMIKKLNLNTVKPKEYNSTYAFKYDVFIKRFVDSLIDITKLPEHTQQKLLPLKLEEIILYLADKYGTSFLQAISTKTNNINQKFTQVVESNQLNKLTLKELAFLANMSVSVFKREFQKQYGASPIKWFQNKRLVYAHYLIHQKQKKSSEIYLEIGYQNLSSFIQVYKAKYGNTPKQQFK